MDKQKPELLRISEISRRLGIPRPSLQYWRYRGALKPVQTAPYALYNVQAVKEFMDEYYIPRKSRTGV
jgi:DNA-binding transcriptional MerR regulator